MYQPVFKLTFVPLFSVIYHFVLVTVSTLMVYSRIKLRGDKFRGAVFECQCAVGV